MDNKLQWAISRILDIVKDKFYGSITLKFESGKLTRIEHQHAEQPPAEAV